MPAAYAHHRFGKEVWEQLPLTLQKELAPARELYDIGLHGPDILFYHHPLRRDPVNQLGYQLHHWSGQRFFSWAGKAFCRQGEPLEGFSYLCGFLCHFLLDRACHGYIGRLTDEGQLYHAQIEGDFDRALLTEDGYDPVQQNVSEQIHVTLRNAAVIAFYFPGLNRKDVEEALRGVSFYHRLLRAPGLTKRFLIQAGMHLTGHYRALRGQLLNRTPDPACVESSRHLRELYAETLPLAVEELQLLRDHLRGDAQWDNRLYHMNFESEWTTENESAENCLG